MSKLVKRILIGLVVVLIGIQFIRPSRSTPPVNEAMGFIQLASPPAEVATTLKGACYDCHSYETKYPWYANVAPVSWWLGNHISEGRHHLNFSEWGKYNLKRQAKKAGDAADEVHEGDMPIAAYTWMHASARLTTAQRDQLVTFFKDLENNIKSIPPMPSLPSAPQ